MTSLDEDKILVDKSVIHQWVPEHSVNAYAIAALLLSLMVITTEW